MMTIESALQSMIGKIIRVWRGTFRPDWETFESMRADTESDMTLVPVLHDTL